MRAHCLKFELTDLFFLTKARDTMTSTNIEKFIEQESSALKDALLELVTSCTVLNEFASVWGRIGLSISQRQVRRETIVLHVTNLLKDIVQEEFELEKTMISSLNNNMKELTTLSEQLGLPKEDLSEELSLYEKEKSVRSYVDVLNKIKFDRQKRLKRIKEMETSLCKELGESSQLCGKAHLPSEADLKCYLSRVEGLEQTLNQRKKRYRELKDHVQEMSTHLDMEVDEEFGVLSDKVGCKDFIYSSDNMDMLEQTSQKFEEHVRELEETSTRLRQTIISLWERLEVPQEEQEKVLNTAKSFRPKDIAVLKEELQRLNELKTQHMEKFIKKTRAELSKIWEDCLFGIQQQREFSPAFVKENFDDDLLSAHESELDRMRGFYSDNIQIFKLIKKREEMYKQYCDLENRDNDPTRFSNRGGRLLKDQALKKKLKKEIPRVEKEINTVLMQWEEDHERFFMVHDSRYLDTVKMQWNEKQVTKVNEKMKRQKEKEVTTILEMTYGSKPNNTPKRNIVKRAAASPLAATVPSKIRKVQQSPLICPTSESGSRLPRARRTAKNTKTPVRSHLQRRTDERRRILAERNIVTPPVMQEETLLNSSNFSLASAGSYADFQHGILQNVETQKYTRSSSIMKNSSMENIA